MLKLGIIFLVIHYTIAKYYNDYFLLKCTPDNNKRVSCLRKMEKLYQIEFWRHPSIPFNDVEFIGSPVQRAEVTNYLKKNNITCLVLSENVQTNINLQRTGSYRRTLSTFNWTDYYRLIDIYNWMYDLEKQYPREVEIFEIGKTKLGNAILAARIHLLGTMERSKIFVEGGIHAREWISPAVVTYIMDRLVSNNTDIEFKEIARNYDWIFLPILNPDGYEYSHTTDRFWRKNINEVDLNRNFDYQFGTVGTSRNISDYNYCGKHAFSEKESSALSNFLNKTGHLLEYYLSFHSYGQALTVPFGNKKSMTGDDYFNQISKLEDALEGVNRRHNTSYKIGTNYETLGYCTSGSSVDWAKYKFDIPHAIVIELRDKGNYGFLLPADQIIPTAEEIKEGLKVILDPEELLSPLRSRTRISKRKKRITTRRPSILPRRLQPKAATRLLLTTTYHTLFVSNLLFLSLT